jgi:hypothetical protein
LSKLVVGTSDVIDEAFRPRLNRYDAGLTSATPVTSLELRVTSLELSVTSAACPEDDSPLAQLGSHTLAQSSGLTTSLVLDLVTSLVFEDVTSPEFDFSSA